MTRFRLGNMKEFIRLWHSSNSVQEVAEKLKLTKSAVYYRRQILLDKGIELPSFVYRSTDLSKSEWAELNELNEQLIKENNNDLP